MLLTAISVTLEQTVSLQFQCHEHSQSQQHIPQQSIYSPYNTASLSITDTLFTESHTEDGQLFGLNIVQKCVQSPLAKG